MNAYCKVQRLELGAPVRGAAIATQIGRVTPTRWQSVMAKPRRRAVAERVAMLARVDNPNTLVRIK